MRKRLLLVIAVLLAGFLAIQLIPYRVSNSRVVRDPPWNGPRARQLAVAACFDCHSNQTRSYWYEHVAPISWWIKQHVDDGRAVLNFSKWGAHGGEGASDAAETVTSGSMPPSYYTWFGLHKNARLTVAERKELSDGLRRSLGSRGSVRG